MSRPTLVTGAAGFAGSHLLELLSSQDQATVGWHRPGGAAPVPIDGVRWQAVDLLDRNAVRDALQSVEPARIYHCAGAAHVGKAWDSTTQALEVNVLGTHHLIEAVREIVPDARLLNLSSALVYAPAAGPVSEGHHLRPGSPYGLSKLAQELVGGGNANRPPVYIARPFNHVGPRQDPSFSTSGFARRIAEIETGHAPPEIHVGNLDPLRDVTDVRDTVCAYQLILEQGTPGRPYNVCTGRVFAVRELLAMMLRRARVQIRIVTDPARYRPNDQPVVQGDPTRIREELGWTAVIPLEQTLGDLLGYWRERVGST